MNECVPFLVDKQHNYTITQNPLAWNKGVLCLWVIETKRLQNSGSAGLDWFTGWISQVTGAFCFRLPAQRTSHSDRNTLTCFSKCEKPHRSQLQLDLELPSSRRVIPGRCRRIKDREERFKSETKQKRRRRRRRSRRGWSVLDCCHGSSLMAHRSRKAHFP